MDAAQDTSPHPGQRWLEWNQNALQLSLARLYLALAQHAARAGLQAPPFPSPPDPGPGDPEEPSALDMLCHVFALSPFERDLLLLCAGVELDSPLASLCAGLQRDAVSARPTFGLALAALPGGHWSALTPSAPLRRYHLIEVPEGDLLTTAPLRISERVLHFLTGISCPEGRLAGVLTPVPPAGPLTASHKALVARMVARWTAPRQPLIELCGSAASVKLDLAAAACQALGLRLYRLRPGDLPASAAEREALCCLLEREALLGPCALLLWLDDGDDGPEGQRRATAVADRVAAPLLLSSPHPVPGLRGRGRLRLEVDWPAQAEQEPLWREVLGPRAEALRGQVERISAQFQLGGVEMEDALLQAADLADAPHALWDACRDRLRHRMEELAQRIEPRAGWQDLILPAQQQAVLRELLLQHRHRALVCGPWGFAGRGWRGLGASALFCGASGTGKTLAAEVLAAELRLDLYRIDLSQLVSKYIGETEKNLRRLFDAAEGGGAVLLFDEADALFGKRSEVRDSHDRYANIEVSYLLQRMESYRGLSILTTNQAESLDVAFLRRLRFIVHFPFPDPQQREALWRRAFPPTTPTEGLEPRHLARLNVSGGEIHNIALTAAYLAAEAGQPVRMAHVLSAARSEYLKLGRSLTEGEIRGLS